MRFEQAGPSKGHNACSKYQQLLSEAIALMLRSAGPAAAAGCAPSGGLQHSRKHLCIPQGLQVRKDHLQGFEKPDTPLALSLRGCLWAAAVVCRKVGGTSLHLDLPQGFERPQCLKTGCSNEYMASLAVS